MVDGGRSEKPSDRLVRMPQTMEALMHKPGRLSAAAAIIGAVAASAHAAAGEAVATPYDLRIDPLKMMARAHGLPAARTTDFSLVFVEPAAPPSR
jgi:hypothetical protein